MSQVDRTTPQTHDAPRTADPVLMIALGLIFTFVCGVVAQGAWRGAPNVVIRGIAVVTTLGGVAALIVATCGAIALYRRHRANRIPVTWSEMAPTILVWLGIGIIASGGQIALDAYHWGYTGSTPVHQWALFCFGVALSAVGLIPLIQGIALRRRRRH